MQGFLLKLHKIPAQPLLEFLIWRFVFKDTIVWRFRFFTIVILGESHSIPFESLIILTSPVSVYLKLAEVKPGIPPGHPNLLPANTGNQDQ